MHFLRLTWVKENVPSEGIAIEEIMATLLPDFLQLDLPGSCYTIVPDERYTSII